ncbi:hypothetical protein [Phyllobacterium sp. UNC302MFCol5.2]|uniref:hypothetical protein n=1 Tax=Phyllobacterium sp. UNC302MFCol5.2 TaxID=1449065 RepID=UPI0006914551|nr:hypothetical protein [Phyllobacterium sp. UNC302MFCol5.2]
MTKATLFDGTVLNFPDGTDPAVIARVAKAQTEARKQASPTQQRADAINAGQTVTQKLAALGSTAADVALSSKQGLHEGAEGLVGQFGDVPNALGGIVSKIVSYVGSPEEAKQAGEYAKAGADVVSGAPTWLMRKGYNWLAGNDAETPLASPTSRDVNQAVNAIGSENYAPKTPIGEYFKTTTSFVPAAAAFGGISPSNMLKYAVLPGVTSETAGKVAQKVYPDAEPLARLFGALIGNMGPAAVEAFRSPESVVRSAVGDANKIDWNAARQLQANKTGVKLSGPEAVAQTNPGGGEGLLKLLRTVEGSNSGGAVTAPFFAKRPAQVDKAVNDQLLDAISRPSATPSVLGPRAAQSAQSVLDDAQRAVNQETRPLYQAAEPQLIPEAQFASIKADPRFQSALERLRANPDLAAEYAGAADNSVKVVDAVAKELAARGETLGIATNSGYSPQAAAVNTRVGETAKQLAKDTSPEYTAALNRQAELRRGTLEPLEVGPVGRVARAATTDAAGDALLPAQPHAGGHLESGDAITRLLQADGDNTRQLVRQNLADRYSTAATETQSGNREFAGAKFARDVAGNQARAETLGAALNALDFDPGQLIDVLRATGKRLQPGSPTATNTALQVDIAGPNALGSLLGGTKNLFTSLITNTGDTVNRARLGKGSRTLAETFVADDSVDLLRAILQRGPRPMLTQAGVRAAIQGMPQ